MTFEKHVYHRDQFAHYLRWTHVLKLAEIGMNILDVGCGSGNLAEVFYRNRYKPFYYLGLDIRAKIIDENVIKFKEVEWAHFKSCDLIKDVWPEKKPWDIICSFEVLEHVGKENVKTLLQKIKEQCSENTVVLISTPVFDAQVGPADNHVVDGVIGELTFDEMENELKNVNFKVENVYGTFASKKDYKKIIPPNLKLWFEKLNEYYDDNLISNLMAPLFPEHSRNCLWRLKK